MRTRARAHAHAPCMRSSHPHSACPPTCSSFPWPVHRGPSAWFRVSTRRRRGVGLVSAVVGGAEVVVVLLAARTVVAVTCCCRRGRLRQRRRGVHPCRRHECRCERQAVERVW
jgi:hypothetical protein